ncbi:transient receptor potential cation channel subfamily M member 2-like [Babylonia areolata]|uniref:transient receptor potential cation channel subfamily M member 2-like n=1 Tax=Babylonia areolata TaxID=304850 RepID=UPI003FD2CA4F
MTTVWDQVMDKLWNLSSPNLFLVVTGGGEAGSERVRVASKVQAQLKRVFAVATVTTGAWLATEGLAGWLSSLVGEAVQEQKERICRLDYQPVILGVAPWARVENSQALSEAAASPVPVHYTAAHTQAKCSQLSEPSRVPLDHNHTHFLLVDDGMGGQRGLEPVRQFQIALREKLHANTKTTAMVVVVVAGGVETVEEVYDALSHNTAVLVLTPTGGAAELLHYALCLYDTSSRIHDVDEDQLMTEKVMETLGTDPGVTARVVHCLKECAEKRHLVNVFSLYSLAMEKGEEAFLLALLKPVLDNSEDIKFRLSVALACNVLPLARQSLQCMQPDCINGPKGLGTEHLDDPMMLALLQDKDYFVQLFLDNGLDLSDFVTWKRLRDLFDLDKGKCRGVCDDLLRHIAQVPKDMSSEDQVKKFIDQLLTKLHTCRRLQFCSDYFAAKSHKAAAGLLFLWAVVFQRQKVTLVLWKEGQDHTGMALCASYILEHMSKKAEKYCVTGLESLHFQSELWEERAKGVISECYSTDKEKTYRLLKKPFSNIDRKEMKVTDRGTPNVMNLTVVFKKEEFASHTACQTLAADLWKSGLGSTFPKWRIILSVFFPFLMLRLFPPNFRNCKGFGAFFRIPIVKFCYRWVYQVFFILGLTVAAGCHGDWDQILMPTLTGFGALVTSIRVLVSLGYVIGACCRRSLIDDRLSLKRWMNDSTLDIVVYVCLGLSAVEYYLTKSEEPVMLILSVLFGYMHFMNMFTVSRSMGVYVVFMEKMIQDVGQMMLIGALSIVGFGVGYHSLMYFNFPIQSWWLVFRGFYLPYLQMFGVIQMEYFQGWYLDMDNLADIDGREKNKTKWEETRDPLTRYPENNPCLPWILAVYLFAINIVFLNLVTAQLNCRYQELEQKVKVVTRFQFFHYVLGYCYCWPKTLSREESKDDHLDQFEKRATEKYLLCLKENSDRQMQSMPPGFKCQLEQDQQKSQTVTGQKRRPPQYSYWRRRWGGRGH